MAKVAPPAATDGAHGAGADKHERQDEPRDALAHIFSLAHDLRAIGRAAGAAVPNSAPRSGADPPVAPAVFERNATSRPRQDGRFGHACCGPVHFRQGRALSAWLQDGARVLLSEVKA
jgi:hypothetical protein